MISSREESLRLVAELNDADPELRLAQLLTNLATLARGPQRESVWDCEDDEDELVAAASRLLTRLQVRHAAVA